MEQHVKQADNTHFEINRNLQHQSGQLVKQNSALRCFSQQHLTTFPNV